jgi:hypothetical protein
VSRAGELSTGDSHQASTTSTIYQVLSIRVIMMTTGFVSGYDILLACLTRVRHLNTEAYKSEQRSRVADVSTMP